MLAFLRRWPLLLPALVLLGLFLYMTGPGFGGTGDSWNYLWAAKIWRQSGQLLAPNGQPYRYWGPLYPLLLAYFYSPAAVRWLHGGALLVHLVLWGQVGRWLLPAGRARWLPWLVALSTAVLVPAGFVWSETVFGALSAAYFWALLGWLRGKAGGWWGLATAAGFLLPLQRTSGFFLLAGAGAGLLLVGLGRGRWRPLLLHWAGCAAGGLAWNYYAEVLAGPPVYQTHYPWDALGSVADYGFVLMRWFLPLAAAGRTLLPVLWAVALPALLCLLFPVNPQKAPLAGNSDAGPFITREQSLRLVWGVVLCTVVALLLATRASRAAAGPESAERYCAALVGPVMLLALARWPDLDNRLGLKAGAWRRWVSPGILGGCLAYSAVRVGHNAQQQRHRVPMPWPEAVAPAQAPLLPAAENRKEACQLPNRKY